MIKDTTLDNIKNSVLAEKNTVLENEKKQNSIKELLDLFIKEFESITFENEVFKTMLLNNFTNALGQIKNNIANIQSLIYVLEILEKQNSISKTDIETYNKLSSKVNKDIELLSNFLNQTFSSLETLTISGDKKLISILDKYKKDIFKESPLNNEKSSTSIKETKSKGEKILSKSIKKIDYASSDFLCFFPKDVSDNLVISTSQSNYKLSFKNDVANIIIEDENFNLSLKTPGVQISNSQTNNILYVSYYNNIYTILTNCEIKMPTFIKVLKISKNGDFLEVDVSVDYINLLIEENVIRFEETNMVEETSKYSSTNEKSFDLQENTLPAMNKESSLAQIPKHETSLQKSSIIEPEPQPEPQPKHQQEPQPEPQPKHQQEPQLESKQQSEPIDEYDNNMLMNNDTLIISDSNKKVILPYTISDLEKKLKNNKKYKSLEDVIVHEYTIPIETFKNPTKSRFREAFQLIKKKEHGSLKEAIELGFELMFQSDLNPAVIAACKDLDELDIYLDCLDDNELEKFSCFKIQYDIPPSKKSRKK